MAETGPRKRRRWFLAAAAALGLAAAVVLAMLLATPGFYRRTAPIGPDPDAVARFDREVVSGVANVLLDASGRTRLDLEITEAMANARLAQLVADHRAAGSPAPPALEDLRVAFEPGRLVLATRLGRGAGSIVVAQALRLSADAQGRLALEPAGTSAGLLPVPGGAAGLLPDLLRRHAARLGAEDDEDVRDLLEGAAEALEGKPVPLRGKKRGIYLESVEIERGRARVLGRRIEKGKGDWP